MNIERSTGPRSRFDSGLYHFDGLPVSVSRRMIRKLIVELALSEYLHKRDRLVPASIPVSNQSGQFIWILR